MNGIAVEHLQKSYGGQPVLRDVSFSVTAGKPAGLLAPSGGGKTTLLRILLGLEQPDSGAVRLPRPCRWAAVFQEDRLLEGLDALGNLRFVLGPSLDCGGAKALLSALGLENATGKPVRDWSGGMRRRLALARALLAPSDALALDEPFAGLDQDSHCRCLEALQAHAAGKPVILATHDLEDLRALGAEAVRL